MYGQLLPTDASRAPTDKTLRMVRNKLYPVQAWYCIGFFIFIVAIFQWTSFFHSKLARRSPTALNSDPEHPYLHRRRGFSWRRIPLGLVNAYRVVAFRWTLEIGNSYTLSVAEVLVTMSYIIFLFVWTFINSKSPPYAASHALRILLATDLEGHKLDISYWCNRSGTLAASQFPLITALGTKNNIITCTGWCTRIITSLLIICSNHRYQL